jgi:hypothetical protein
MPPQWGYSAQVIRGKSICPIHSGGFLLAMLTWFDIIIRSRNIKKEKQMGFVQLKREHLVLGGTSGLL